MSTPGNPMSLVLIIAGHDPSGAAGVQADIETMLACGVRCASLLTATTTQDTTRFVSLHPQRVADFAAQAELLLADMRFSACKIGLLGDPGIAKCVCSLIPQLGEIPVVLDPILRTGTGAAVADSRLIDSIRNHLLPLSTVVTPNLAEARLLSGCESSADAGQKLLTLGARNVLITGADEGTPTVINTLYQQGGAQTQYEYRRLAGIYHGSGCTLSASLAAYLALGFKIGDAVRRAQEFTWSALSAGGKIGRGQMHPDRIRAGHEVPDGK